MRNLSGGMTVSMTVFLLLLLPLAAQPANRTDRAALIALFLDAGGSGWVNSRNWLTDRPLREWHGVQTDATGRVIGLTLFSNGLAGKLPPELGDLTELRGLSLYGNSLAGVIPRELGNLARLTTLVLHNNDLTGQIPPEIGNLSRLSQLLLDNNRLKGEIPSELGNLANLELLALGRNRLSGEVSPEFGGLAKLQRLWVRGNRLRGSIPPTLLRLRRLGTFHYHDNPGLCLPDTPQFNEWIARIDSRGPRCGKGQ